MCNDRKACRKQRKCVVSFTINKKIDTKVVADNRIFCKTVKPFLSEPRRLREPKSNLLKVKKSFLVTTRLLKSSMITL